MSSSPVVSVTMDQGRDDLGNGPEVIFTMTTEYSVATSASMLQLEGEQREQFVDSLVDTMAAQCHPEAVKKVTALVS